MNEKTTKTLFNFSTKLFFRKENISEDGSVSLYIRVYISSSNTKFQRKFYPLNIRWPHKKVNLKDSTLKSRHKDDPDVNDYNMIIMSMRSNINEVAKRFRLSGRFLTIEALNRELQYLDGNGNFITFMKRRRRELRMAKEIGEQTYKNQGGTIARLEEFSPDITFEEIDARWMRNFVAYLKKQNNSHNTIWTRIKDVKSYLAAAKSEHGFFVLDEAVNFVNRDIQNESTYLFKEEVLALMQLLDPAKLTDTEYNVLRAFLFCCFTGFRISDLYNSKYSWMTSDNFLRFTMVKNGQKRPKTITVPLIPMAKILIQNSHGSFFELPTSQEYNRTLKDLAKMAGIVKTLTSHVARHTFGHLFMSATGDIYTLKKILGHSKIATTEKYAHVGDMDNFSKALKIQESFLEHFEEKRERLG